MRKSKNIFKTAFVSEAGAELANNDYFSYIEDNDFACYVLAAGDLDGAQKAYLDARNLSNNIADRTQTSAALDSARITETKGDEFFDSGDYTTAQMYYLAAIEQYIALYQNIGTAALCSL